MAVMRLIGSDSRRAPAPLHTRGPMTSEARISFEPLSS
jgi:hypothetical protein